MNYPKMLEEVRRIAWLTLMRTAKYPRVILQVGYLIDRAQTVTGILDAVAMIGEFEAEEEGARFEAEVNAVWALSA